MLEALCQLNGISGHEHSVREFIKSKLPKECDVKTDALGNLIVFKKGRNRAAKKLMIAAHMDEVGMIVTYIKDDGTLAVSPVGGVDPRVVIGRQVSVGKNGLNGVIGSKAVHNLSAEERKQAPKFSGLYVDIGASSKKEAEKVVALGDMVTFSSQYTEFGDGFIKGKAIDDRAGCEIMLNLLSGDLEYDAYFVFTVQEEIGTRGAKTAAFTVAPEVAIVLETTTAADIPIASAEKRVCALGNGAVVSFMDRGTIYDRELYHLAFRTAEKNGIPVQTKTMVAGGNDSSSIHVSGGGVRTLAVSAPCRYLHSPSCVVKKSDLDACEKLVLAMISEVQGL